MVSLQFCPLSRGLALERAFYGVLFSSSSPLGDGNKALFPRGGSWEDGGLALSTQQGFIKCPPLDALEQVGIPGLQSQSRPPGPSPVLGACPQILQRVP